MSRLARWKMYFVKPDEPDIALKMAEQEWWDSIVWSIVGRAFVQSLVAVVIGMSLGIGIMQIGGWLTGEPIKLTGVFLASAAVGAGCGVLGGCWTLVNSRQKEMIRSKRLREAMLADDAENPDPQRLLSAND